MKTPSIYIAFVAFVLYSIYNFFYLPAGTIFGDEDRFIREAVHFASTLEFRVGADKAWEMPLVGVFYGAIYYFIGSEQGLIYAVRFLQSIMLIFQAFLISSISYMALRDNMAAKIAFVWVLFYPFFVYYQGLLLSETIFITLLIASFYFLYKWKESEFEGGNLYLFLLFSVAAIYTKATTAFLVPLLAPAFVLFAKKDIRKSLKILVISCLVYMTLLSPWWVRNYVLLDSFVPFTTSSAYNLYLGNNPANKHGGCDWSIDVDREEVASMREGRSELERSSLFKSKAKDFIAQNPDRFLELAWMKFKRFYNITPNAESFNSGFYKWVSVFTFGPVLFLFVLGVFVSIRKFNYLVPIYALIAYFTLIHMIVISSLRYRVPIEPFMIIVAAFALSFLVQQIKSKFAKQ